MKSTWAYVRRSVKIATERGGGGGGEKENPMFVSHSERTFLLTEEAQKEDSVENSRRESRTPFFSICDERT